MNALRLRSFGIALRTATAASTLALVATGDGPTAAPARPAGAFAGGNAGARATTTATTPSATTANSLSDAQRAFNAAGDVLRNSASAAQRAAGGNMPPHVAVGNLVDTLTVSAVQPVIAGRARLSAMSWFIGEKATVWHAVFWDTEKNIIAIKAPVVDAGSELAINVMRENNRVYVLSCAITAPFAECSAIASTEGWSKVYPILHNLPDMVYWVIPAKKDGPPGWVKASLAFTGTGGSWAISQCEVRTYQAP